MQRRGGYSFVMNTLRPPEEQWEAVENYFNELLTPSDPILDAAMKAIEAAGLPSISVAPHEGRLLWILARMQGARNILEIGTLGGYSTIWLARALAPGGKLITLEFDPKHAAIARENIARAGLAEIVELRLGRALESLPLIAAEARGPFDLVFIDADKKNNWEYFEWALKVSRRGSVIIVDNVVRDGAVVDASSTDSDIRGIRRFIEMLAKEKRVSATALSDRWKQGLRRVCDCAGDRRFLIGDVLLGPRSKRDSSTACPGASRKGKGAGHCARNDDSRGNALVAPASCRRFFLCTVERQIRRQDGGATRATRRMAHK